MYFTMVLFFGIQWNPSEGICLGPMVLSFVEGCWVGGFITTLGHHKIITPFNIFCLFVHQ